MPKNINIIFIIFGGNPLCSGKQYSNSNKCTPILGYHIHYKAHNALVIMFKFKYGSDC